MKSARSQVVRSVKLLDEPIRGASCSSVDIVFPPNLTETDCSVNLLPGAVSTSRGQATVIIVAEAGQQIEPCRQSLQPAWRRAGKRPISAPIARLARILNAADGREFIINSGIGIHPNALLNFKDLGPELQKQIQSRIAGYENPVAFYVDKLTEGIATLAAAFYPKPVIVRLSDFKSNEYAQLIGGEAYEEKEENPMIGFRGASRYIDSRFRDAFALECQALRRVRNDMGLTNVAIMVPFVRSVDELLAVQKELKSQGLERGKDNLQLFVMCEVPTNALLADRFLKHCDGFSIGSNDLTQLTLGVDRDSQLVTGHDERDDAVKVLMKLAIDACKAQHKYIGICGQAPSDWPEITRWLVEQGIESISLNADTLLAMRTLVADVESKQ